MYAIPGSAVMNAASFDTKQRLERATTDRDTYVLATARPSRMQAEAMNIAH